MQLFKVSRSTDSRSPSPGPQGNDFARLITDNLAYIEKQCRRAVLKTMTGGDGAFTAADAENGGIELENRCDELLNEVLDRLRADDFRALREFKGKAKLTTYLTTIVSNLIIDLVREKKGRSRAKERARDMGEVGERLYDLVYLRGCTVDQAHSHLEVDHGILQPLEKLQEMVERMRGRADRSQLIFATDPEDSWLVPGARVAVGDDVEVVVTDPRRNAEESLIDHQKSGRVQQAVAALLGGLSGEEMFMLRLRFPNDDSEPRSFKEIGTIVGASENGVDARIRRILLRFRETLLRQGLTLHDLI